MNVEAELSIYFMHKRNCLTDFQHNQKASIKGQLKLNVANCKNMFCHQFSLYPNIERIKLNAKIIVYWLGASYLIIISSSILLEKVVQQESKH
jgi:hypothetical protein